MRAYYSAKRDKFITDTEEQILGELTKSHNFALEITQRGAWQEQIRILKKELAVFIDFNIYFEFSIPRMGKRVDVLLLVNGVVFVLEFKIGSITFDAYAIEQVEDYALDLKNFHEGCHECSIYPILIASLATSNPPTQIEFPFGQVAAPLLLSVENFANIIDMIAKQNVKSNFDEIAWENSSYKPTPTIIEAARRLYSRHGVEDITKYGAGAKNLGATQSAITDIIETSKKNSFKSIAFVTGVPGAGKTLAGLNIATQSEVIEKSEHATFLSGNGPLVDVLREALARDQAKSEGLRKSDCDRRVRNFIQNIHKFRDEYLLDTGPPSDRVVIFDEAQRAWSSEQASKFMKQKRNITDFAMSEPEFLLSVMDRHEKWCSVVCLIGGGQEINTGEAGITEWLIALRKHFPDWRIFLSDQIRSPEYGLGENADEWLAVNQISINPNLHLSASLRTFKAENLGEFIFYLLDGEHQKAKELIGNLGENYPIFLSRDINECRKWLRIKRRGSERSGMLASSGAIRLKPEGINVKSSIEPANWFLNDTADVRSSNYLEDVATEFDVQGLEVDWACLCWDGNLRRFHDSWTFHNFKGTKWQNINDSSRKGYLLNAYRVLLTRARQGLVIFVPRGTNKDYTRPPVFYDDTYNYLSRCGIPELPNSELIAPKTLETLGFFP